MAKLFPTENYIRNRIKFFISYEKEISKRKFFPRLNASVIICTSVPSILKRSPWKEEWEREWETLDDLDWQIGFWVNLRKTLFSSTIFVVREDYKRFEKVRINMSREALLCQHPLPSIIISLEFFCSFVNVVDKVKCNSTFNLKWSLKIIWC